MTPGSTTLEMSRSWRLRLVAGKPLVVGSAVALLWLAFSLAMRPLSLPEEGRYVGVAWEMLRSGDWIVPTQDGLPFLHKPPLFYWLTAASLHVFGGALWAARLAPLLGAMLGGAALFAVMRRWCGDAKAGWATVALATMPLFFAGAQFANLDMLVGGLVAAAIVLGADAVLTSAASRPHSAQLAGAWAAAAFAILAKGLIGIVLPSLVLLAWLALTRRLHWLPRLLKPVPMLLFAAIVSPWFVAMQIRQPEFAHFFFVYQHFQRFASGGFNNVQPWWFFIATVPILSLPWSLWLVRRLHGETELPAARQWQALMWAWLGVVLVFFSIPQSKPLGYAMPLLFPIAALAGAGLGQPRPGSAGQRWRQASAVLAVGLCVAALLASLRLDRRNDAVVAAALRSLRAPGDQIVFVGEYFFDVPFLARLADPVPVVSHWNDPAIAERDNWKRELWEAAPMAPQAAARILLEPAELLSMACGRGVLWLVSSPRGDVLPAQLAATPVIRSERAILSRVERSLCPAAPALAAAR